MPTSEPYNKRAAIGRLRPLGVSLLIAALVTVLVGALYVRLGPVWPYRVFPLVPQGIVIHHSATDVSVSGQAVDAAFLDRVHSNRGWGRRYGQHSYHIGYHYVILPDGTVESGRPEWMPGAHADGYNDYLGICLVGDFSVQGTATHHPTRAQINALVELLATQMRRHHIPLSRVLRHCDVGRTKCPGAGVPWADIVARVKAASQTD